MKLLVLLLCLMAIQYAHVPRSKLSHFFAVYQQLWINALQKQAWFHKLTGLMVVAVASAVVVYWLALIPGIGELIVSIAVVLVGLSVAHEHLPDYQSAPLAALNPPHLSIIPSQLWQVNYYFITPLFWYLILGPAALMAYSVFVAAARCPTLFAWQALAKQLVELAAWLPCRLTGLAYAFSGNIKATLKVWTELLTLDTPSNHAFLLHCAYAACQDSNSPKAYQKLLRDSEILLLGLFAILVLLFSFY